MNRATFKRLTLSLIKKHLHFKKQKTKTRTTPWEAAPTIFNQSVCVCVCGCVEQSDPWSGLNLLDWDVEVLQPTTFPAMKVGGSGYSRGNRRPGFRLGLASRESLSPWRTGVLVHGNDIWVRLCGWGLNVCVCVFVWGNEPGHFSNFISTAWLFMCMPTQASLCMQILFIPNWLMTVVELVILGQICFVFFSFSFSLFTAA